LAVGIDAMLLIRNKLFENALKEKKKKKQFDRIIKA
jgi:hypothetical protein